MMTPFELLLIRYVKMLVLLLNTYVDPKANLSYFGSSGPKNHVLDFVIICRPSCIVVHRR